MVHRFLRNDNVAGGVYGDIYVGFCGQHPRAHGGQGGLSNTYPVGPNIQRPPQQDPVRVDGDKAADVDAFPTDGDAPLPAGTWQKKDADQQHRRQGHGQQPPGQAASPSGLRLLLPSAREGVAPVPLRAMRRVGVRGRGGALLRIGIPLLRPLLADAGGDGLHILHAGHGLLLGHALLHAVRQHLRVVGQVLLRLLPGHLPQAAV